MDKYVKFLKDFVKSHKVEFTVLFIMFFLFLLFGRVNAASNTDVEYIYSYGVGEYVDTGIVPTANTEIEIQYEDVDPFLAYERIFSIDKQFGLMRDNSSSDSWKIECGNSWDAGTVSIPSTGINTVKMGKGIITVNGVSSSYSGSPNTDKSIYLFHGNGTDRNSSIRIYYCKIWEDGSLVRDFVPAIDSNNVVCLYDNVSAAFFYNSGGGALGSNNYTPSDEERGVFEFTVGDNSYTVPALPTYHNEFNIDKFIILEYRGDIFIYSFSPKDGYNNSDIKVAFTGNWCYENCYCRVWYWYGNDWEYYGWQPDGDGFNTYDDVDIWGSTFNLSYHNSESGFHGVSYAANIDIGSSTGSLPSLDISMSDTGLSNGYVTLKTTNFPSEMLGLYKVKYRWNDSEWLDMELTTSWQYSTTVGESGTYKFAYFDIETDEMVEGSPVSSLTVTTILSNIKYDALIPEPRLSASLEVDDEEGTITAWIETQEMQNYDSLDCYFITNAGDVTVLDNISNWTKVDKNEAYDGSIKKITYKYPVYDTCRVYCIFHNPEKGDYGYSKLSFIDIDIDKMYQDYLAGIGEDDSNPIIDFIVGIFVPDENFFSNMFSIVNEFFGTKFGVLYYPIEVVLDFLNRFYQALTNDDGTAVINVPELKFMDVVLIPAFTFDFYSILEDDTFKIKCKCRY